MIFCYPASFHIVEQLMVKRMAGKGKFAAENIHNTKNLVELPNDVHKKISALYSRIMPGITGSKTLTVRKWLESQSYERQYEFGLRAVENVRKGIW
jgi:hypothetical protein